MAADIKVQVCPGDWHAFVRCSPRSHLLMAHRALLIQGLDGLTPAQVQAVDPAFIAATGLQASLTPSRANGFLNILLAMQEQARQLDS